MVRFATESRDNITLLYRLPRCRTVFVIFALGQRLLSVKPIREMEDAHLAVLTGVWYGAFSTKISALMQIVSVVFGSVLISVSRREAVAATILSIVSVRSVELNVLCRGRCCVFCLVRGVGIGGVIGHDGQLGDCS